MWMRITDYDARDEPWLVEGLLSGSRTTLSGVANAGKSTLALNLTRAIVSGGTTLGARSLAAPGAVAWVGSDGGWRGEIDRRTVGWPAQERDRVIVLEPGTGHHTLRDDSRLDELRDNDVRLVIIDNLTGFVGDHDLDSPHGFHGAIAPFEPLIGAFPVLLLAHAGKGSTTGAAAHSHAINDWGRVNLQLGGAAADSRQALNVIANEAPTRTLDIKRTDSGYVCLGERLKAPEGVEHRRQRDYDENLYRANLIVDAVSAAGGPISTADAGMVLLSGTANITNPKSATATVRKLRDMGLLAGPRGRVTGPGLAHPGQAAA